MTTKKLFVRTVAAMGVLLAFNAPALADKTGEFTAGVNAEYFRPDDKLNVETGFGYRFNGGYRFSDQWSINGSYINYDTQAADNLAGVGGHDVTLESYRLEGQYFFNPESNTQPYIGVGMQKFDDDIDIADARDQDGNFDTQLSLVAGLRHYFNERVSLNVGVNLNHDFDGMADYGAGIGLAVHFGGGAAPAQEAAAATEAPAACADGDADGVCDTADRCPGTPAGVKVDANGCPAMMKEDVTIEMKVLFDTDKSVVKGEFMAEVEKVASFLREHADTDATIEGHTDGTASDAYNQALSERRAAAVRDVLVSKFGIDAARLKAAGYGESRPVADNATVEGRAQNRRVISVIVTQVAKAAQ